MAQSAMPQLPVMSASSSAKFPAVAERIRVFDQQSVPRYAKTCVFTRCQDKIYFETCREERHNSGVAVAVYTLGMLVDRLEDLYQAL